jgi:LmbE family N-acetylglucosaminyl deacetylase
MQRLEFFKNKRILVVVAHPDDELLGLGASMNRLINEANIYSRVIILGEGITSRDNSRDVKTRESELAQHKLNAAMASKAIGYHEIEMYGFPDNRFDTVPLLDLIKVIEKEKDQFKPDIIFTHHGGDVNVDHQRTFDAVITATRPMEHEIVKTIITFETPSGTEWRSPSDPRHFLPNLYISFTADNLMSKIIGMESYMYEKRNYPHPRSPEALKIHAQRIGIIVGSTFAEAFCIIRHIIN